MTRYAVAILIALNLPASAEDLASANQMLPGCKAFIALTALTGISPVALGGGTARGTSKPFFLQYRTFVSLKG